MTTLNNFKQMRVDAEIKELRECIEVIDYNIDNIAAGIPSVYSYSQQMELKAKHLARIAELESPETPMDMAMRLH